MFNETTGLGADQSIVQSVPGASEYGGSNIGPSGKAPGPTTLVFNCTPEYIAKYRAKFGQSPAGCGKEIPPEAIGTIFPDRQTRPVPTYILPPRAVGPAPVSGTPFPIPRPLPTPTPTPPPVRPPVISACSYPPPPPGYRYTQGPQYDPKTNCGLDLVADPVATPSPVQPTPRSTPIATVTPRRPRPRRRALIATGEACPHTGYVTRPLPGTSEYGVFPCRPGGEVKIDPARMASLTAGAKARGLSDMDEIMEYVQQEMLGLPMWIWAGIAVLIFMFLRGRR